MKVALRNLGGLGNQMHRYAHARALCEQNGYELHMEPSVLAQVFTLDGAAHPPITGKEDIVLDGYRQRQQDINYTRRDCRRWFAFRPEVEAALGDFKVYWPHAHFRRGDYAGAGFPLVSRRAVDAAVAEHQFPGELRKNMTPGREYIVVSDESPTVSAAFAGPLQFLPDFYKLATAPVLYRANSTFSWWAAVLGHGRVFAPVIDGLQGGIEHDNVRFVEGNWPKCADLPGIVEDLHLPP